MTKKISIITLTFNCVEQLEGYFSAVEVLDSNLFDWIVIDGNSTDGTAEVLKSKIDRFDYFKSEPDAGFYYGLNKAVLAVSTPYYVVFGADDRPSKHFLNEVLPLLNEGAALILGGVCLMPTGKVKWPGPRWIHPIVWGRAVSHHSVGTVIRTDVHQKFGMYDTNYSLVADGALLKRLLASDEKILPAQTVFGEFALGGMSSKGALRSMLESFQLQVGAGSNWVLQLFMLNLRLIKFFLRRMLSRQI